ncbi:hypothetical protein GCM10009775_04080 [Microbacterium aoyamense]|uniref:DUF3558 domain-containing protein n=1 Tax=Microbacterium aoyamense TaxID=344166 RepID=A0ABN2P7L8_9MICO|nr:hypothetical protein [Microbacterium aoyamense]
MKRVLAVLGLAALLTLGLTACAGTAAETVERPEALRDLPVVALHSTEDAANPVLAWDAVGGAGEYLLTVAGADGPLWAWRGDATSVRFGGYDAEPSPGTGALRLTAAAWWSVSAFDDSGALVAVSELHAVSPDGSSPAVPVSEAAAADAGSEEEAAYDLDADGVCPLVDDVEAEAFLEGALVGAGAPEVEGGGRTYYCRWERADDELLELSVSISPNIDGERWADLADSMSSDPAAIGRGSAGIGEDSIVYADWGGTMVQIFTGNAIVQVRSGFTQGAEAAQIELAKLVIERWGA